MSTYSLRSVFSILCMFLGSVGNAASQTKRDSTTPTCTQPTGLANTFVPAPLPSDISYKIAPSFVAALSVFVFNDLPGSFSEASIATFCFEQCVAFQPNATRGQCLSFNVNYGSPVPPTGDGGPARFYCTGFDALVATDGSDFQAVDVPGSFLYPISVNRVCNGSYRAY